MGPPRLVFGPRFGGSAGFWTRFGGSELVFGPRFGAQSSVLYLEGSFLDLVLASFLRLVLASGKSFFSIGSFFGLVSAGLRGLVFGPHFGIAGLVF